MNEGVDGRAVPGMFEALAGFENIEDRLDNEPPTQEDFVDARGRR